MRRSLGVSSGSVVAEELPLFSYATAQGEPQYDADEIAQLARDVLLD